MKNKRKRLSLYLGQEQKQVVVFRHVMACCIIIPVVVISILLLSLKQSQKVEAAVAVYPDSTHTITFR